MEENIPVLACTCEVFQKSFCCMQQNLVLESGAKGRMRKIIMTSTNAVWGLGDGATTETVIVCKPALHDPHINEEASYSGI